MNYEKRTEEIFNRAEKQKKLKRKKRLLAAISIGLCGVVFGSVLFVPYPVGGVNLSAYKNSEYYSLMQTVNSLTYESPYKNNWERWTDSLFGEWGGGAVDFFPIPSPPAAGGTNGALGETVGSQDDSSNGSSYWETTDNQVDGVIEGDLFKRSDEYIFYLSRVYSDGGPQTFELNVYSIAGEASQKVGSYTFEPEENFSVYRGTVRFTEMYLSEDCNTVTVLTQTYDKNASVFRTAVIPFDVSDVTHITQGKISYISGEYVSSRYTEDKLLVVTNFTLRKSIDFSEESQYLPQTGTAEEITSFPVEDIITPQKPTEARYTVICSYEEGAIADRIALLSYTSNLYVSTENIYPVCWFTQIKSGEKCSMSEIARVSYTGKGLEYKGSATVEGAVKNQYSLDEKDGVLRAVTTVQSQGVWGLSSSRSASLYCIDIETFREVAILQSFAPEGESVQSVRFDGDTVNVCTAVIRTMTDPVFVINLSDLNNITVKETGEIGGYSTSLKTFTDGTLLGIGYDERSAFKAELYAETEYGVEVRASYIFDGLFSEDYKSYLIDAEHGLIGLCVYSYSVDEDETGYHYLLLRYDGTGFVREEFISLDASRADIVRSCIIDEYLYILSDGGMTVIMW